MFGSKKEKPLNSTPNSGINMLVAGTVVTGDLSSKADIRIDGKLEGNLRSEAKVVIGKNALIIGDIFCASILIEGKVEGNIDAREKLHIQSTGHVVGNLSTNKLIIEDGSVFNGASVMGKASMKPKDHGKQESREGKKVSKAS